MKFIKFLFFLLSLLAVSCDDGRIYEETVIKREEGRALKLTGRISGQERWTSEYSVVIAGFNDESEYAVITKDIPIVDTDNKEMEIILSGISNEVTHVSLCIINKLRKCIVAFQSMECNSSVGDTIYMEAGTLDVGMFTTIQNKLFDTTCANCHGSSTQAAAGLYLTKGKSHAALINKPSRLVAGKALVNPGKADESVLFQVLTTSLSTTWGYDHSKEVLSVEMQDLIGSWINGGAEE